MHRSFIVLGLRIVVLPIRVLPLRPLYAPCAASGKGSRKSLAFVDPDDPR
jgi:hypothetical protein